MDALTDHGHCGAAGLCSSSNPASADFEGAACAADQACFNGLCITVSQQFQFPLSTDTINAVAGTYFWTQGNYVEGSRTTTAAEVRAGRSPTSWSPKTTCPATPATRVRINGTQVGTWSATGGVNTYDFTFTFPAITGPTYTLHYEVTQDGRPRRRLDRLRLHRLDRGADSVASPRTPAPLAGVIQREAPATRPRVRRLLRGAQDWRASRRLRCQNSELPPR